jgi:hypothetical protein
MPTTFVGLVLFLVVLAPGFCLAAGRERWRPPQPHSALRETAIIGLGSVLFNLGALSVFALIRAFHPGGTPDVGALIRDSSEYLKIHYLNVSIWGLGLLAGACAAAFFVGAKAAKRSRGAGRIDPLSGWTNAFTVYPASWVKVGCELTDDTFIEAWLRSFSPDVEETADRSLVLSAPAKVRRGGEEELEDWDVGTIVIAAGQIRFLTVGYYDHGPA